MHIILGSQSPRRRELLHGLDIAFDAVTIDADEHYPAGLTHGDIPRYISEAKAHAYAGRLTADDLLITSDTIVWLDGQVLGKPRDEEEASMMLRQLSGKTHQVYTAVTFTSLNEDGKAQSTTMVDCADVTFAPLSDEDIRYYVSHYRPLDKAGAYGIQEWIGYTAATAIRGSFYTIMGLPVHLVHAYLSNIQKKQ